MDVSETSCEVETWIYLIYVATNSDWILCNIDEPSDLITA
jgi:hypothetical protein